MMKLGFIIVKKEIENNPNGFLVETATMEKKIFLIL